MDNSFKLEIPGPVVDHQVTEAINSSVNHPIDLTLTDQRYQDKIRMDRTKLLAIFPEEVWELIMDKIEKEDDLESLCNSAIYFRDLKHPRRAHHILKNVLKIMLERSHKQRFESPRNSDATSNVGFDKLLLNLRLDSNRDELSELDYGFQGRDSPWFKTQLKLRLVSRSFCNVVDEFYQNQPVSLKPDINSEESVNPSSMRLENLTQETFSIYGEANARKMQHRRFYRHFKETHAGTDRNPFLGRKVFFEFSYSDQVGPRLYNSNNSRFFSTFPAILTLYGQHIWHCVISGKNCGADNTPYTNFYCKIIQLLRLLPNLKVLHLLFFGPRSSGDLSLLKTEIDSRPLPTFEKLETLIFNTLPEPIFREIIRANGHLSTLSIDKAEQYLDGTYDLCATPLPKLTTLFYNTYNWENFENITSPQANWPLTKLCLKIAALEDWQKIFSLIENCKWSVGLIDLELTLPLSMKTDKEIAVLTLSLPRLKYLTLNTPNSLHCLDFLLPLKDSLVRLDWRVKVCKRWSERLNSAEFRTAENGKLVKFLGHAEHPLESSIWTQFRRLQRFHFEMEREYDGISNLWTAVSESVMWSHSRAEWQRTMSRNSAT